MTKKTILIAAGVAGGCGFLTILLCCGGLFFYGLAKADPVAGRTFGATGLQKIMDENPEGFRENYVGKVVLVRGQIGRPVLDNPLLFAGHGLRVYHVDLTTRQQRFLSCTITTDRYSLMESLRVGQMVTIKGSIETSNEEVWLRGCELVNF